MGKAWIFRPAKSRQEKYVETTCIFQPVKLHRKSKWKQLGFLSSKLRQKSMWKRRGFFNHESYIEKNMWKRFGYFDQRNYMEKVCGNDVEIC